MAVLNKTYIEGFDEALDGGIPMGHVVLISGPPGTMKSSVAFSILYNNAKYENVQSLYVCLEQSKKSLLFHMSRLGMADEAVHELVNVLDLAKIRKAIEDFEQRPWLDILKKNLDDIKKSTNFELLVVDTLPVLEIISGIKEKRIHVFHFFEWLRELGLTAFIISEMPSDSTELYDEDFLADGVIHLMMQKVGDVDVYRRIRCVKMRGVNHSTSYYTLEYKDNRFQISKVI
jgi:KaiC/GvpD/RAD55 family RecA-like ATPase